MLDSVLYSTVMTPAIGRTTAKMSRHDPSWSRTPETAGPSAGATDITRVTLPITLPRSCGGTRVSIVVMSSGIMRRITERLYNAEWALTTQYEIIARQFDDMEDPYLRERKADLEQVVERVLRH